MQSLVLNRRVVSEGGMAAAVAAVCGYRVPQAAGSSTPVDSACSSTWLDVSESSAYVDEYEQREAAG